MRLGKQRYESKYMTIKYFYESENWSINWMCKQLSVSRVAYYINGCREKCLFRNEKTLNLPILSFTVIEDFSIQARYFSKNL